MELKVGHVCDRGLNPKRPVNQDRFLAIAERGLFAVFDGVGGQRAGEVASQTAAETIEEALAHTSATSSAELILRAIKFANRDIYEMAENDPAYKTMATTIALLHLEGDRATIAHVGDSRVYRLEEGHFYRETIDHTDANDDLREGVITKQQAAGQSNRNAINRALGVEPDVDVEIKTIRVNDGARFLLCSDGIYRHLPDDEIALILVENKDPQRAADEMKRVVHERGAEDNLTAVVVQVGRARQSRLLAIEDGMQPYRKQRTAGAQVAASASRSDVAPARGGRIQVDFGGGRRSDLMNEGTSVSPTAAQRVPFEARNSPGRNATGGSSATRKIMYTLLTLVLVAGAFYAGLRASDYVNDRAPNPDPARVTIDPQMKAGREAFDNHDYQAAATHFASLLQREPQNAEAHYWLGRALLEQRDYARAAQNFEDAIRIQPTAHDAYVQAAAAYEAGGDRAKSAQMLARYGEERRRAEQGLPQPQR